MVFSHVSQWFKGFCSATLPSSRAEGLGSEVGSEGFSNAGTLCSWRGLSLLDLSGEQGQGSPVPCAHGMGQTLTPAPLLLQLSRPVPVGTTLHSISRTPATAASARGEFRPCPVPGSRSDLVKALLLDLWNAEGSDPCWTLGSFSLGREIPLLPLEKRRGG